MTFDRRVFQLFDQCFEMDPAQREAWLLDQCQDNPSLIPQVLTLIRASDAAESAQYLENDKTLPHASAGVQPPIAAHGQYGPYHILRQLGAGGMGTVYLAERREPFQQRVALKTLNHHQSASIRRFNRERQILAKLEHPNIARLLDGGEQNGIPYLIMEFIEGVDLVTYAEQNQLDGKERLQLAITVCQAVGFAHRAWILHRDLKPANILVNEKGEPKLLDFGIASLLETESGNEMTVTYQALSPAYASPEQWRGERLNAQSDLYSLGIILYELFTGTLPYPANNPSELLLAMTQTVPLSPSKRIAQGDRDSPLGKFVAGDLDSVILACMAQEPSGRYPHVSALIDDLTAVQEGRPVRVRRTPWNQRLAKWLNRNPGIAALAASLMIISGLFIFSTFRQYQIITHERDLARLERDTAQEVSQFLLNVFRVADPKAKEQPTLSDLLAEGTQHARLLKTNEQVRARMLSVLGWVQRNLGQLELAETCLSEAESLQRGLPEAKSDYVETLLRLSFLRRDQGDLNWSQELVEQAQEHAQELNPAKPVLVAHIYNQMGLVAREQGHYPEAEQSFRQALNYLKESDPDKESPGVLQNIGLLQQTTGRSSEAEVTLKAALAEMQKEYGSEHPQVATCLNNLGLLYKEQNDLEQCERAWRHALSIRETHFPPQHPQILTSLNNLASLYFEMGQSTKAAESFQRLVVLKREVYGSDHPSLAITLNNLAVVLLEQSEIDAAEKALSEASSICNQRLSEKHVLRFSIARNQALLKIAQHQLNEALRFAQYAVDGLAGIHPPTSTLRAHAEAILAHCQCQMGQSNAAVDLQNAVDRLPPNSAYAKQAQSWLETCKNK
ncbi:MAG: serine/threonine protein kinase [Acidobacteria bacterium]|nr:serine/threonine protein kinase [Acidobacteriota bacterium]MCB9399300.1 serine/threonine protein kinase [Acidobacteriota bacterium]